MDGLAKEIGLTKEGSQTETGKSEAKSQYQKFIVRPENMA